MSKLFYTSPLEAAYMSLEFNIAYTNEICGFHCDVLSTGRDTPHFFYPYENDVLDKYTIHPKSLYIFEPQDGDKGTDWSDKPCYYEHGCWWSYCDSMLDLIDDKVKSIDKRNGTPFFMPQREE